MKSLPTLHATNLTVSGTCGPEDISSVQFPIDDHTVAMTLAVGRRSLILRSVLAPEAKTRFVDPDVAGVSRLLQAVWTLARTRFSDRNLIISSSISCGNALGAVAHPGASVYVSHIHGTMASLLPSLGFRGLSKHEVQFDSFGLRPILKHIRSLQSLIIAVESRPCLVMLEPRLQAWASSSRQSNSARWLTVTMAETNRLKPCTDLVSLSWRLYSTSPELDFTPQSSLHSRVVKDSPAFYPRATTHSSAP